MKFTIVGYCRDLLPLIRAVNDHPDHRIVANYNVVDPLPADLIPPQATDTCSAWERLLHDHDADAIIVGRAEDEDIQAERLRKLTQAGTPLFILHPGCESIVGYELEMIREESRCPIVPYIPAALDPAVDRLSKWSSSAHNAHPATLEHLVFERPLTNVNRRYVLQQFSRDVSVIRRILGGINQVTALGVSPDATVCANLNVHMQSSSGVSARWSASPAASNSPASLTVISVNKTVTLTMPDGEATWTISPEMFDHPYPSQFPPMRVASALEAFVAGVQTNGETLSWMEACQDIEISESISESLRRRRTIDLHYGEISEQSTFHGLMAIGGCGLLFFSAGFLLLAAIIEGLRLPFRHHVLWKIWPLYLLTPLALFLMLQLLKFVFPTRSQKMVVTPENDDLKK